MDTLHKTTDTGNDLKYLGHAMPLKTPPSAPLASPFAANPARYVGAPSTRPITEGEKISLLALVSFVADSLGQPEDRVHQTLQEALNIASLDAISAQHYDHAIQFLVDQVPQNTVTA